MLRRLELMLCMRELWDSKNLSIAPYIKLKEKERMSEHVQIICLIRGHYPDNRSREIVQKCEALAVHAVTTLVQIPDTTYSPGALPGTAPKQNKNVFEILYFFCWWFSCFVLFSGLHPTVLSAYSWLCIQETCALYK